MERPRLPRQRRRSPCCRSRSTSASSSATSASAAAVPKRPLRSAAEEARHAARRPECVEPRQRQTRARAEALVHERRGRKRELPKPPRARAPAAERTDLGAQHAQPARIAMQIFARPLPARDRRVVEKIAREVVLAAAEPLVRARDRAHADADDFALRGELPEARVLVARHALAE